MKTLSGTIVFSLALVGFVIGVDQTLKNGIGASYSFFAFSGGLILLYFYLRVLRREKEEKEAREAAAKKQKPKRKR